MHEYNSENPRYKRVQWAQQPKKNRKRFIPIISPRVGQQIAAYSVSNHLVGVQTHFVSGRTRPCLMGDMGCEHCKAKLPQRWKGYLGVQLLQGGKAALFEVTLGAWEDCPALVELDGRLRGRELMLKRLGRAATGKVQLTVGAFREAMALAPEFDVHEALFTVWEV